MEDRWLLLKESGLYLNMNNVSQVDAANLPAYVVIFMVGSDEPIEIYDQYDAAKVIEWLDKRAYA